MRVENLLLKIQNFDHSRTLYGTIASDVRLPPFNNLYLTELGDNTVFIYEGIKIDREERRRIFDGEKDSMWLRVTGEIVLEGMEDAVEVSPPDPNGVRTIGWSAVIYATLIEIVTEDELRQTMPR